MNSEGLILKELTLKRTMVLALTSAARVSLASILFIKSKLPCRAIRVPDVILSFREKCACETPTQQTHDVVSTSVRRLHDVGDVV